MFYQPGITSHGLPRDPFKACVVPRPIGWISTRFSDGTDNLAPFSQFNNLTFDPPYVMFSANQTDLAVRKDTTVNTESTGEFVWNIATFGLREAVNITAEQFSPGIDEFTRAGLSKEPARLVNCAMVRDSPIRFECQYHSTLRLPGNPPMGTVDVIIGRVVAIHISDDVLTDGLVDIRKVDPIARCGYYQYARITETFDMVIPGNGKVLYGLEGSATLNSQETMAQGMPNKRRPVEKQ